MIRRLLAISAAVLMSTVLAAAAPQIGAPPPADAAAIRAIVDHWRQTWDTFDASSLSNDYADDADWLNAFGNRLKGRADILAFMQTVVKRPNVKGRQTTWQEPKIRFIRPDVAVATRDYTTVGHKTVAGQEIPERHTHGLWVLAKQDGGWRIVSQMISDDNGAG
jgi:uncharacterized protein (TIGR02246 family)